MKPRTCIALFSSVALALSMSSCATQKASDDKSFSTAAPKVAGNDDMPVPPKDAQYTIYCQQFNSPNHMAEARQAKQILTESTAMKKWYIVHGNDQSTLYYGFYRSFNSTDPVDGEEAKRALADLNAIRVIQDSQGGRLFSTALPVPIDEPDPEANAAWDLTKTNAVWSIEIGSFNAPTRRDPNGPLVDRKEAAVEAVREARKQGIEAYYYHGPTASSVCIGAWPAEAAIETTVKDQNTDPNKPLFVTPQPLSPEYAKELGGNVQTSAPTIEPIDPTFRQALIDWKEHDLNGEAIMKTGIDPVTHQETQMLDRPFPVKIPHPDGVPAVADKPEVLSPDDNLINPTARTPGAGQLRSLGK